MTDDSSAVPPATVAMLPEVRAGLIVRPGDRLLIAVPTIQDPASAGRLSRELAARYPDIEITVVAACDLAVVRSEES